MVLTPWLPKHDSDTVVAEIRACIHVRAQQGASLLVSRLDVCVLAAAAGGKVALFPDTARSQDVLSDDQRECMRVLTA
jgi:hypothetical protein